MNNLKSNKDHNLAFIKLYIRNTLPNLNEKCLNKCYKILFNDNNTSQLNHECLKIFVLFKPIFVNYEYLNSKHLIDLIKFFYTQSIKQFEIFQKQNTKNYDL